MRLLAIFHLQFLGLVLLLMPGCAEYVALEVAAAIASQSGSNNSGNTQTNRPEILAELSNRQLCEKATHKINGKVKWKQATYSRKYEWEAKARNLECGVEQDTVEDKTNETVSNYIVSLPDDRICYFATTDYRTKKDGGNSWETKRVYAAHVAEAKKRKLDCGTSVKKIVSARKPKQSSQISNMSDTEICIEATIDNQGRTIWSNKTNKIKFVKEAKSRGLECLSEPQKGSIISSAQAATINSSNQSVKNNIDEFLLYAIERLLEIDEITIQQKKKLIVNLEQKSNKDYQRIKNICEKAYEDLEIAECDRILLRELNL